MTDKTPEADRARRIARMEAEREAQGLPPRIEDPVVLLQVAAILQGVLKRRTEK